MELFAVFRQGVYRRACGGIWSSRDAAIACADRLARIEGDCWHRYEVVPFVLDRASPVDENYKGHMSPDIHEASPIYRVNKGGPLPVASNLTD